MNRSEIDSVVAELALSVNDLSSTELRRMTIRGRALDAINSLIVEIDALQNEVELLRIVSLQAPKPPISTTYGRAPFDGASPPSRPLESKD